MDKILETLKGLLQKGNELLGKLPFKGLAEKYIPAGAKEKVPFLETFVTPYANQIVAGLAALLLVAAVGGSGGGGGSGGSLNGSKWEGEIRTGWALGSMLQGQGWNQSEPPPRQYTYVFDSKTVRQNYVEFSKQGNRVNSSSKTGTYIVDGNNVFMTFDGDIEEGTIEGSILTVSGSVYTGNIEFKPGKSSGITRSSLEALNTNKKTSNSETDYKVRLTSDNAGVIIEEYTGTASRVKIPAKIQGLPVREMGYEAFRYNKVVTSVIIPEGVASLPSSAFSGCTNLSSVTLPSNLKEIGNSAFYDCKALTSIKLPASLTELGERVFEDSGLTSFPNPWPKAITVIPDNAFSKTNIRTLVIPEGITSISWGAFSNCNNLTSVTFPSSLTKISGDTYSNPFKFCPNLDLATQARIKELSGD